MRRTGRIAPGGYVYHALNRCMAPYSLFESDDDFVAFERTILEAIAARPIRLLGYCLLPNHWHLVLWPRKTGDLTNFLRWLTNTHSQRWHALRRSTGSGHLYQGRYKAFPVEGNVPYLSVLRYVESNALRAGLVGRAEEWRWGSLAHRLAGADDDIAETLSEGPTPLPRNWKARVNRPQTKKDIERLRLSVNRGQPYGSLEWQATIAKRLGLESTFRGPGRPRKLPENKS